MLQRDPLQILLIEDDDVDREAVRRLLDRRYQVHYAPTGEEALQLFQRHRPDSVLLDYRLPDIDGLQLLPVFAREHVPVVMLTGEESPEVIVEAMRQGAQDYLVKGSLSRTGLDHAIANAIEKAALKRDLVLKQQQLAEQADVLAKKNRQLRSLASALTLAEQHERRRISEILHDHVQQYLHGVKLRARFLRRAMPKAAEPLYEHLDRVDEILDEAIEVTRSLAVELSPPVLRSEGLGAALRWLAVNMKTMHGLDVRVVAAEPDNTPSEDLRVLLFRLVQELLFNVVKHAGVEDAEVTFDEEDGYYVIHVIDEGQGFDVLEMSEMDAQGQDGMGLFTIRERLELFGGVLDIRSARGEGTKVTIQVPVELTSDDQATVARLAGTSAGEA